jgi:rhodanese-related sulfurtransferase
MPTLQEMLSSANEEVPKVTAEEAHELMSGRDALLVDVRDASELAAQGKLRGAVNVSRGMLEFRADPNGSYHNPELRKDRPVILYCASGGRSALAGKPSGTWAILKCTTSGGSRKPRRTDFRRSQHKLPTEGMPERMSALAQLHPETDGRPSARIRRFPLLDKRVSSAVTCSRPVISRP